MIVLSIIDGASEKIVCSDLEYLKKEMKFAYNRIQRLKILTHVESVSQLLSNFMHELCTKFPTYEDLKNWHTSHNFKSASEDYFAKFGL